MTDINKRSQLERITIAESLLDSIWEEFCNDEIDTNILQTAVYCQVYIDRIVWKLNKARKEDKD